MISDLGALLRAMTPQTLPALPATSVPSRDAAARDADILQGMAGIRDKVAPSPDRDRFFALLAGITQDMKDVDGMPHQEANATFKAAMDRAQARLHHAPVYAADSLSLGATRLAAWQGGRA